jgi:membrane-bound metal-dependent hydrolase YbcI (DUF457 family)
MTVYEHAMLGTTLALGLGTQRRHGWEIVAMAAAAAALPDWDGLTLALGPQAYAAGHRTWGHNLLAATLTGVLTGAVGYLAQRSTGVRRALPRFDGFPIADAPSGAFSTLALGVWVLVGAVASLSHLAADLLFSGTPEASWPVPLLWPWSDRGYVLPLIPWGDLGATLLFIAGMFALYHWRSHPRLIAVVLLLALSAYVGLRGFLRS